MDKQFSKFPEYRNAYQVTYDKFMQVILAMQKIEGFSAAHIQAMASVTPGPFTEGTDEQYNALMGEVHALRQIEKMAMHCPSVSLEKLFCALEEMMVGGSPMKYLSR